MPSEIPFIDPIRDAIIAYRDEQSRKGVSDREVSRRFGVSAPQLARWLNGEGTTIRLDSVKNMMPYIARYIDGEVARYITDDAPPDFNVSIQLHAEGHDIYTRLSNWLQFDATHRDRQTIITLAESLGFSRNDA